MPPQPQKAHRRPIVISIFLHFGQNLWQSRLIHLFPITQIISRRHRQNLHLPRVSRNLLKHPTKVQRRILWFITHQEQKIIFVPRRHLTVGQPLQKCFTLLPRHLRVFRFNRRPSKLICPRPLQVFQAPRIHLYNFFRRHFHLSISTKKSNNPILLDLRLYLVLRSLLFSLLHRRIWLPGKYLGIQYRILYLWRINLPTFRHLLALPFHAIYTPRCRLLRF